MQRQTPPETIALTPAGRAALEQELHHLRTEQVPALARRLAEAREDSATREEDAGLLELQEEQHRAGSRAVELDRLLSMAREIASSTTWGGRTGQPRGDRGRRGARRVPTRRSA